MISKKIPPALLLCAILAGCATTGSNNSKTLTSFKELFVGGTVAETKPSNDHGHITFPYDTGESWGTSIDIWLNEHDFVGSRNLALEIKASEPVNVGVYIAERGNGLPEKDFEVFPDGSDGESFTFKGEDGRTLIRATTQWQAFSMPLDRREPNLYYGNQKGNKTLNLGGIESISFLVPGKQGKGTLEVRGLKFLTTHP